MILICFPLFLLFGQDFSTPEDGNLFIDLASPFIPGQMEVYENAAVLIEGHLILANDRIYGKAQNRINIDNTERTLNTDIAWINDESYVVLTGESQNYPHGILGDKVESRGFEVYTRGLLAGKYELPDNRVFETLRPLIADIIPDNPGEEIILTSSNIDEGARVEVYSQKGEFIGNSDPIGRGYRWLHILGAAAFNETPKKYIAIVKTPHIKGSLELLYWNGESLESEVSLSSNLSTHHIGSSNLNMALLLNMDSRNGSELLIPSSDFRKLLVIKYSGKELKVIRTFELPGRISSNIYFDNADPPSIWIGLSNGMIVRILE